MTHHQNIDDWAGVDILVVFRRILMQAVKDINLDDNASWENLLLSGMLG